MAQNWTHLNLKQLLVRIVLLFGNASVYADWATLQVKCKLIPISPCQLYYRNSALGLYTSALEITDIYTHTEAEYKGKTISCSMYSWYEKDKLKKAEFMNTNAEKIVSKDPEKLRVSKFAQLQIVFETSEEKPSWNENWFPHTKKKKKKQKTKTSLKLWSSKENKKKWYSGCQQQLHSRLKMVSLWEYVGRQENAAVRHVP